MTDEQHSWLEKAKRNLLAARRLLDDGFFEVATSRAYYTMFYVATALLLEKGLRFSKHSAVISAFGQHFTGAGLVPKEFHRWLLHASDERNVADYLTEQELTIQDAREKVEQAAKFIELGVDMLGTRPGDKPFL